MLGSKTDTSPVWRNGYIFHAFALDYFCLELAIAFYYCCTEALRQQDAQENLGEASHLDEHLLPLRYIQINQRLNSWPVVMVAKGASQPWRPGRLRRLQWLRCWALQPRHDRLRRLRRLRCWALQPRLFSWLRRLRWCYCHMIGYDAELRNRPPTAKLVGCATWFCNRQNQTVSCETQYRSQPFH